MIANKTGQYVSLVTQFIYTEFYNNRLAFV